MSMEIDILTLRNKEIHPFAEELFRLRITVFAEYPYLWQGTIEEERNSVSTKSYLESEGAMMIIAKDRRKDSIIGISTANTLKSEMEDLQKIFSDRGLNPAEYYYFRESMILPEYRGLGIGKLFFQEREKIARLHPEIKYLTFLCVERPDNHPKKPKDYRAPYSLWKRHGFSKKEEIKHEFEWKQIDQETKVKNPVVFWVKNL